uniref:ubiquitinyl hydrolase 1 n=1 Tax=Brassica oleracea var. oleracea TaxID=109376 RepID=A0A0D3BG09_BRAOL
MRPNTRNKNKRQRPSDSSSQILRKIYETNDITEEDLNQVLMIHKEPLCQGCRDNPNCFCALTEAASLVSGRRLPTSEIIQAHLSSSHRRASHSTPAGLTNLGATCYANSILQCLYMNRTLLSGMVFSLLKLSVACPDHCATSLPRCSKCGRDSEASSQVEDFYALELNVKGLKSLDDSLSDYLCLEHLDGDNQYFCGSCHARVDATRCIKLRTLPPVFTFLLKPCVFLPKTTAKKKITSSFSFPQVLDMRSRLAESSENEFTYELSAVLIHKGSAGHYVAHIKDENTGLWWNFDDEQVSELGTHPFIEGSSSTPKSESNGASSSGKNTTESEVFSSTDAYMLIYSLRSSKIESLEGQRENPIDITKGDVEQPEGGYLPPRLDEWISDLNATFLEGCKQFDLRKERELNTLTERRQEVRTILSEAAVQSLGFVYGLIPSRRRRALDNTPLLCSHGKVLASKITCMKRISELAWTKLESKGKGTTAACRECLMDGARMVVSSDSYRDRRTFMKSIAGNVLSGKFEDGEYYVSKAWLQQWVKRKNLDAPSEADAGRPTNAITCSHGGLMPEQAPGAKRILVPENFWSFLVEDALKVTPEDTSGCPCFPLDSSQCSHCTSELSEVADVKDALRTIKAKQRQNHEKLATGKGIALAPQSRYFLVPSPWLVQWRSYINMTGKNSSSVPEPELLNGVIDTLKCEKVRSLLCSAWEDLKSLVLSLFTGSDSLVLWLCGVITGSTEKLTIIPEDDWKCFCEEWGGIMENGVSAFLETGNSKNGSASQDVIDLEKDMDIDTQQLILRTSPEVCEECIGDRESRELMQKLSYSEGEVSVCLVRGKEAPKSMLEASDSGLEVDRRTSKRSRRTNYGKQTSLKVSATTTVYQLKMMIWQLLGVMKENQELHKGTQVIDQESATLADMNIFPGDKLWVRDTEIHEHRDIAENNYPDVLNRWDMRLEDGASRYRSRVSRDAFDGRYHF